MRKIGILTSGGDSSGMNAAIRAAVRTAVSAGVEVIGFRKGFLGVMQCDCLRMDTMTVAGIVQRGGTILHSARCKEFMTEASQTAALENLKKLGVEGLIVIGGDGSLKGALALNNLGLPVIGIPASIDNDIPFTDMSLGVDTAMNNIVYAVDCIKDTASSHERTFVIEVMGRNCGYLASMTAIAVGAEFAIVPESPFDTSRQPPGRSPKVSRSVSVSRRELRYSVITSAAERHPSLTVFWEAVSEKGRWSCSLPERAAKWSVFAAAPSWPPPCPR